MSSATAGKLGTRVVVYTNNFAIKTLPRITYYQYDLVVVAHQVDGSPPKVVPPGPKCREIIERMQDTHIAVFTPRAISEGASYSTGANVLRGSRHVLALIQTTSNATPAPTNAVATNLLQLLISQAPNIQHNFALQSKSFYISRQARDLQSGGLQAWTGFFQSVKPVLGRVLINVDTTTAAVYKPGNLLNNAMLILKCDRDVRELVRMCAGDQQAWRKLQKFYKGVVVTAPSKKGKIAELVLEGDNKEGTSKAGGLWCPDWERRYYPAELCDVVPGQLYKKKLDPLDTAQFLKSSLRYGDSEYMREAGLSVNEDALQVNGRQLSAPTILYASESMSVHGGSWNVVGKKFQRPAKILAYAIVCFDTSANAYASMQNLARKLVTNLEKLGVVMWQREPAHTMLGNQGDVSSSLDQAAMTVAEQLRHNPNCPAPPNERQVTLILTILPQNAAVLRKEVKQWSDCIRGIATQCVREGKYENANDQYCNNLALKINTKCGGINSFVRSNLASTLIKESMIVGVTNRPSVASVVSSIDAEATRYSALLSVQEPRTEIITEIKSMIQSALVDYRTSRKVFPSTLVVFRDGVSEGEYAQLENSEIQQINDLLLEARKQFNHTTKLVYIVVGKRHHVRFFPSNENQADKSGNCAPGLVVDTELVHSKYLDFYLQSHAGILGQVAQWTADQLQDLAYSLCFVYAASTRSVSIPAPVYYADRVCSRAEFQFRPDLDYADETSSSSTNFDLEQWRKGFANSKLRRHMYFV
ncbi:Piwi domain-containing protein [Irpex lacteus]|nr:Piwi domain-containing protein [Irpex lacteus]